VSPALSSESAPELVAIARSQEAFQTQRWLAVDGKFGPESARALQVFLTRKSMNPGKIDGVFGSKAKRAFQEFLRVRGYDVGKIDGFFGPRSVMALQAWVKESGFSPKGPGGKAIDGIWGAVTTRALQQTLNMELGASSPSNAGVKLAEPANFVRSSSSSGTLNSLGLNLKEDEPKARRTMSQRRSRQSTAASAA
jgi:hypothetical protein